jgi:uncharacterized repeat protein (TIGR01451 family)
MRISIFRIMLIAALVTGHVTEAVNLPLHGMDARLGASDVRIDIGLPNILLPGESESFKLIKKPVMTKIEGKEAYVTTLGEDDDEVIIGDESSATFKPQVKLTRWNKENYLTLKYTEGGFSNPTLTDDKLLTTNGKKSILIYKANKEDLKFVFIFTERPATNKYTFELEGWEEFDFFYQAPFPSPETFTKDGEEWLLQRKLPGDPAVNHKRARRVDGSYAVYHKTKRDHIIGRTNYKTGKAFHIYVPKLTDAAGKTAWAKLHIENGIYTVTIPKEFLEEAAYPIVVNDTFGDTVAAGNAGSFGANWIVGDYGTPTGDATATTLHFWQESAGVNMTGGMYNHLNPGTLFEDTEQVLAAQNAWTTYTFDNPIPVTPGITYRMAMHGSGGFIFDWDAAGAGRGHYDGGGEAYVANEMPDPLNWDDVSYGRSIALYTTYTLNNTASAVSISSVAQRIDGSGHIDISFTGTDADGDNINWVDTDCEYSRAPYTNWTDITFDTADASHTADEPMAFTSSGASFVAVVDVSAWANGNYKVRLKVNDGTVDSSQATSDAFAVSTSQVIDSVTESPIPGVIVTLYTASGAIYAGRYGTNPTTSDANGLYNLEADPGSYYITATKEGYEDFTSSIFTVNSPVTRPIVMVPLDQSEGKVFSIINTPDKKAASIGDVLTYQVAINNVSSSAVDDITVDVNLPHGMRLVKGSTKLAGVNQNDPSDIRSPLFTIASIAASSTKNLTYRVIVGPDTKIGKNKNYAYARGVISGTAHTQGPAIATVDIREGVFAKTSSLIGKVYNDINKNGKQDKNEKGIPGIAVVLDDGQVAITDKHGRYSFPEVSPGIHAVRLDQRMLPGGPLYKDKKPETRVQKPEPLIERRSLGEWIKEKLGRK